MLKEYLIVAISLIIAIAINVVFWTLGTDLSEFYKSLFTEETPKSVSEEFTPTIEVEPGLEENEEIVVKVTNPRENPDDFQAGISFFVYKEDLVDVEKIREMLNYLVSINLNSINITFPIFQENWTSSELYLDDELTPSIEDLRLFIQEAHERNFTIMLRPLLYEKSLLLDNRWRGNIEPDDVELWFGSYTKIILDYAELAQEENVEIFCIGAEFNSLEHETEYWEEIAQESREIYDGQLTYSVNWDLFGRDNVKFWDKLDFIGIDAFFPLYVERDATKEDLVEAWKPWILKVANLKEVKEKPVLFTEIGTMSQEGSFRAPWRWNHGTPVDLEAQANYYKASCIASKGTVDGIYWWNINLDFPENPQESSSFNPIGKPAEDVIIECFSKPN